jgi:hypothetical protein
MRGALLAYGTILLFSGASNAQTTSGTSAHDPARARALFDKAYAELNEARKYPRNPMTFEAACQLLEESLRLDRSPGTLINLAHCRRDQGKIATAHALYQVAADFADDQNNLKIASEARQFASEIAEYRSFLTIHVNSTVPGLKVSLDGTAFSPAEYGTPIPIDPGDHTVTASAEGYKPKAKQVTIGQSVENQSVQLEELERIVPSAPPSLNESQNPIDRGFVAAPKAAPIPPPVASKQTNPWPWVLGGVGATAVLVGSVSGILALHDDSTVSRRCHGVSPCSDVGALGIQNRRNFERSLAWATIPVGIAAVGAAATWLILARQLPESLKSDSNAAVLDVSIDTHGGAILLGGRF